MLWWQVVRLAGGAAGGVRQDPAPHQPLPGDIIIIIIIILYYIILLLLLLLLLLLCF